MNETIPKKAVHTEAVLPLIEEEQEKPKATEMIEFILQQRAGTKPGQPSYKVKVRRFCEGTVGQWIDIRKSIAEMWTQNAITKAQDQVANVTTILRGDSLTSFEDKIQELMTGIDDAGEEFDVDLTEDMVLQGLNAVARTVFPHRALEVQKQWMRRRMKKPKGLSFRKTVSAVGRLNNSLPLFPDGDNDDKFNATEILEILEWTLPDAWRAKLDLDGFVASQHSKERLIAECEAIERNAAKNLKQVPNGGATKEKGQPQKKSRGTKHKSATPKNGGATKYYCSEHGKNHTHSTVDCHTLKNRTSRGDRTTGSGNKKSFRNEINAILSRDKPRKKVLEMFATFVEQEQGLMAAQNKSAKRPNKAKTMSRRGRRDEDSSESEGEMSIACIDQATDEIDEANSYQSRIENLGTITDDK
jgi:hypothetical protein